MELTGSEYWTYFLPRRVGKEVANHLTSNARPITANQPHALGMVDDILQYSPSSSYHDEVSVLVVWGGIADYKNPCRCCSPPRKLCSVFDRRSNLQADGMEAHTYMSR